MARPARVLVGVAANETGVVRLFSIGQPISVEGLRTVMEATRMDPKHVDILDPADLGAGGLYAYMVDALGLDPAEIDRAQIDALSGTVAFIRSKAFRGQGQNLQMLPPIQMIGEYREAQNSVRQAMSRSASAQGELSGRKRPSAAAMSGRVATVALVVMFALVVAMIVVGG